jgi:hypothetical protein
VWFPLALSLTLAAQGSAGLTLVVRGGDVRTVELGCRSGHRERRTPRRPRPDADPQVHFPRVPGAECTVYFKGVTPSRYGPVPQEGTLLCQLDGRVARCAVPESPTAPPEPSARPVAPAAPVQRSPVAAPPPPRAAHPPAGATRGAVEILLLEAPGVTGFELSCRGGFRARAARPQTDTPARFAAVPEDDCRIHFRGTPPAVVQGVRPDTSLRCEMKGVTALCATRPAGD